MNTNGTVAGLLAGFRGRGGVEDALWYHGHLMQVLADGAQTGGAFALLEMQAVPGNEPPRHVHEREDETFYILEGHGTFYVGDEVIEARAGDAVFMPRGVPHSFKIRSESSRVLLLITPSGFENWFREFSVPAQALTLPPAQEPPADIIEKMLAAAPRYGTTFLPPSAAEIAEGGLAK